jgi:hypothetical protein
MGSLFPTANRSARSKKPQRVQTMFLWTLCVSGPQVMTKSAYLLDARYLLRVNRWKIGWTYVELLTLW